MVWCRRNCNTCIIQIKGLATEVNPYRKDTVMITLKSKTIVRAKADDKYNQRVIVTKTVYNTIFSAGKGIHSVQDIQTAINNQLKADEHFTEKEVRAVFRAIYREASCNGAYPDNNKVRDLGCDFYEFKKVY